MHVVVTYFEFTFQPRELEHLQPRPQNGLPKRFIRAGAKKTAQSCPQDAEFRRLGPFLHPALTGRTRRTGGARGRSGAPAQGKSVPGATLTGEKSSHPSRFASDTPALGLHPTHPADPGAVHRPPQLDRSFPTEKKRFHRGSLSADVRATFLVFRPRRR